MPFDRNTASVKGISIDASGEYQMKPVEISKNIFDVGVCDWNIRDFHGYSTHMGTSYNAFLVKGDKTVLIDTVKEDFGEELLHNIGQVMDPKDIDYVISNHTEMDHSGSLPRVMHTIGEDKPLFCSKMGRKNLESHFHKNWNFKVVGTGDTLSLGDRTLAFLETRMLHWPDSMFTYLQEEEILFSSDGFGQHYAGLEKYDDVVGEPIMEHAKKYYANILLPYSNLVIKLVEKVGELGLNISMICPDHGVIWRKEPKRIIDAYIQWANQEIQGNHALVIYETMWKSTEKMAKEIAAGMASEGINVRPMRLRDCHRSDIMTEVMDAKAVVVGSPTLNNGVFPSVSDLLTYMKGLKPKNKTGAAFGSYGWSGESVKHIHEALSGMNFDMVGEGLKVQYVPDTEMRKTCYAYGREIGQKIKG